MLLQNETGTEEMGQPWGWGVTWSWFGAGLGLVVWFLTDELEDVSGWQRVGCLSLELGKSPKTGSTYRFGPWYTRKSLTYGYLSRAILWFVEVAHIHGINSPPPTPPWLISLSM